jgi:hypothetical protein
VPDNRQMLCPDVGGFGGTNITLTGGKSGSDAAPGVAGTSGGTGATSGVGGAGSEAGGVSSDAGRSGESGGTRLSYPSTPPIEEQQRACDAPGVCPYPDGTACRCEACAGGWCWSCSVAELPFGCPRLPPKTGESCPWTGVLCPYDTCGPWNTTSLAGCCLGEWHVSVRPCVSTL